MSKVRLCLDFIFVKKEIMSTKKIKDSLINLFVIAAFAITLVIVSCNDKKKSEREIIEIAEVKIVKDSIVKDSLINKEIDNLEVNSSKNEMEIKTRTYKMKDGSTISYYLDAKGIAGFEDWKDFTIVNTELAKVSNTNFVTTSEKLNRLNYKVANLRNSIPAYLKTEEVMEDVADIQKEYLELISEKNASEKEIIENLEEFNEQFDDLKEELDETLKMYIDTKKDAIEEFNEKMDEGKLNEAIEEYNEEMKKYTKNLVKNAKK